ncbi:MAG TPA: DUF29 domain-containing protein [Geminicoccaceae bacterium]
MTDLLDRPSLYERDFYLWTREQARLLREAAAQRMNTPFDLLNLAEEIESLGRSDRRAVVSRLARIIEHALKLDHSPAGPPRRGWKVSIQKQRVQLRRAFAESPSLRGELSELAEEAYEIGRLQAFEGMIDEVDEDELPRANPYRLDDLLDPDWFPDEPDRP